MGCFRLAGDYGGHVRDRLSFIRGRHILCLTLIDLVISNPKASFFGLSWKEESSA